VICGVTIVELNGTAAFRTLTIVVVVTFEVPVVVLALLVFGVSGVGEPLFELIGTVVVVVVVVELVLVVEILPSNCRPNVPSHEILQSPFVTIGLALAPTSS
jgi:hypothetical protein